MKKLLALALAVATAILSPLAANAANTPDNVGDVTYLGNIVAGSTIWQWTVNDYPTTLRVNAADVVTASSATTYPLNGVPFIAVSGYMPSFVPTTAGGRFNVPTDKTSFTDQNGQSPADVLDAQNGAVTFTIAASGTDKTGASVSGTLLLKSTEMRGTRFANSVISSGKKQFVGLQISGSTSMISPTEGGSCFSGVGSYTSTTTGIVDGTALAPIGGEQSATSFAQFIQALDDADAKGDAPRLSTLTGYDKLINRGIVSGCSTGTGDVLYDNNPALVRYEYLAAAHVVELTPLSLKFATEVQGAWNSTLTVTAYQM